MPLTYNPSTRAFALVSNDRARAEAAGLTLSRVVRGPNGELVWFTAGHDRKPCWNPYAALMFWDEADDAARSVLAPYYADYRMSWAIGSDFPVPCPSKEQFRRYQNAGVEYSLRRFNSIIGDDMGVGKTMTAIGLSNSIGAKKTLCVVPASIRENWQRRVKQWSTIPHVKTCVIMKGKDKIHPDANYVIISYDLLANTAIHEQLCATAWDHLILDEAHMLKSIDAKRTKAVFGSANSKKDFLAKHAGRVTALTGTPLLNRPRECYTLVRGLNWEAIDFMSYDAFCFRFNPSARIATKDGDGSFVREEKGRMPELQARLRCNLMVRRLKDSVLPELPDKTYEMAYVEENGAISEVLAKERLLDFDPQKLSMPNFTIDGQISTVRREMGEAKVPRVIEHMKYLLDVLEIPKVVMFSHHRTVMDMLRVALDEYGVVEVRGGVGPSAKQRQVDQFVANDKLRIFSGQIDSAGFGIDDLQKVCNHVVFAEPAWVPGANQQCVDRLHRLGQHNNVIAQFLIVEGSLDERILETVLHKAYDIHKTLDGGFEKLLTPAAA